MANIGLLNLQENLSYLSNQVQMSMDPQREDNLREILRKKGFDDEDEVKVILRSIQLDDHSLAEDLLTKKKWKEMKD